MSGSITFHQPYPTDSRVHGNPRLQYMHDENGKVICDKNGEPILADPDSSPNALAELIQKQTDRPAETQKPSDTRTDQAAQPDNARQNQQTQANPQRSQFNEGQQPNANLPKQFGQGGSVREVIQQMAEQRSPTLNTPQSNTTRFELPPRLQQLLNNPPSAQNYKAILQEKFFQQGPLKGTPLNQKLLEMAKLVDQQRLAFEGKKDPLNKAELMQMFRLRNQAEEKDRFKEVLRNELAKAKAEAFKKVQSVRYQTDSQEGKHEVDQSRDVHQSRIDKLRDQILDRLGRASELTPFEKVLKKILTGLKLIPDVPEGAKGRFGIKTDAQWAEFFKNMTALQSELSQANLSMSELAEALFRGLYVRGADGKLVLVTDLMLNENGELVQNKFAQIPLTDKALADALKKMMPGETIDLALLKKLGENIDFIKLANMVQSANLTEAQKQEILKQFQRSHSEPYTKKIEAALLANREENKKEPPPPPLPFVYAGLQPEKKLNRAPGKTKLWIYLLYAGSAFAGALTVYILLRWVF